MGFIHAVLALFLSAQTGLAQAGRPSPIDYDTIHLSRVITALRITEKITLDGRLEEPVWSQAEVATDFIQRTPRTGEPSRERTEARFLYDDENFYAGISCYDSDAAHMVINELKEDFTFNDTDGVTLVIDSLNDRLSGFNFVTNPAGARRDVQVSNDTQSNQDWDGVWDVKVTRNNEGYFIEYMIPFKTLRFSNEETQEWGINVSRRILRLNEESHWSPLPFRFAVKMSMIGHLRGLEGIRQGRNLKVKPYVTAGVTQVRGADGVLRTTQGLGTLKRSNGGGYDGGVDLKYSITPSLTLDATYRTDFAQVEADTQQVNLTRFNLFFPEKRDFFLENAGIFSFGGAGTSGNLLPFFSRRIGLSTAGNPIPILGGSRVSGKVGQYDVGFLAMKTERQGTTPSNNFLVGRIKRNLLRNSWVGTLVTQRDSTISGDYNRVYGSDAHFQFWNKLEFDSYILWSDTPGRSGENNQARRLQSAWKDDELTVSAEYNEVNPDFNPEVGFIRRRDMQQYKGEFVWKPLLRESDLVRNLNFGTSLDYYAGSGTGKIETRISEATAGILFENNASINFVATETFDRLPNVLRIPSGNPRVALTAGDYNYLAYELNFSTNQRKKIAGSGTYNWGDFYDGRAKTYTGALNLKPNYHLVSSLTYTRNNVTLPGGSFTTDLVGARFLYAFTPRAFFNAFIQYNANTHQVSSNLRFNWTHHPLSDIFFVYSDTRDTLTNQLRDRAFIVKFTNLFNF
jgi:hypothetical protein